MSAYGTKRTKSDAPHEVSFWTQSGPFVPCSRPLRLGDWRELREESRRATFNFC
jgi:hypothetical protein